MVQALSFPLRSFLPCSLHIPSTASEPQGKMRTAETSSDRTTFDSAAVATSESAETSTGGLNDHKGKGFGLLEECSSPCTHGSPTPTGQITSRQATPDARGTAQVEQTGAPTAGDGKAENQNDAPTRFRRMLSTVEAKLRYSGAPSHEAADTQLPRRNLVDEHGNCLLGCEGKCKYLPYPPGDDDKESGDDLYLMSGALGDDDDTITSNTPSCESTLESGARHKPDGNLCIRDKAIPRKDLDDLQVENGSTQEPAAVEEIDNKQSQAPTLGRRLSNITLVCRTMFDSSKRSKPVSDTQTPSREDEPEQEAGQASPLSSSRPSEEYYRLPEGLKSDDASWLGRM